MPVIPARCNPPCTSPSHTPDPPQITSDLIVQACRNAEVNAVLGLFTTDHAFAVMFEHESDQCTFFVELALLDAQIAAKLARDVVPCQAGGEKNTVVLPEFRSLRKPHSVIAAFPHAALHLTSDAWILAITQTDVIALA